MNRAVCLASLLVLASLPAFANDRSQIAAAVREVVEQKGSREKQSDDESLRVRIIDAIASEDEAVPSTSIPEHAPARFLPHRIPGGPSPRPTTPSKTMRRPSSRSATIGRLHGADGSVGIRL